MPQLVAAHLSAPPPRPSIARPDIPAQVDAVIAKGMAKEPDQRYATTVELARDALDAITPPSPRPAAPGAPVQFGPTERVTPPGLRQQHGSTAAQMSQNDPTQHRPASYLDLGATPVPGAPRVAAPGSVWKRHRAAAAGAIAVVAVLAIVASIIVVRISMAGDSGTVPHDGGSAAPNAPALTGTFTVDFGPQLNSAGNPQGGPPSPKATWHLRSGCGANGCIANAINDNDPLGARVFDYVDGRWLSVTNRPAKCKGHDGQEWNIISLQPTRDGTLSGEFFLQNSMECYAKGTVTFTRTGDTDDGQLRDPGNQPRRVVSPAEALHGSYHTTATFEGDSQKHEADFTVRTYCMRTGDSCISYFYRAEGETDPLVFTDGRWLLVKNFDYTPGGSCGPEARGHIDGTREFPLPQPLQNPMTLLTGYGSFKATGPSCVRPQQYGTGQKFERTGE